MVNSNSVDKSTLDSLRKARERRVKRENSIALKFNNEENIILQPKIQKTSEQKRQTKKIKKPPTKSLAIATKQLASMINTGLPIVEALRLVAETSDNRSIEYSFNDIASGLSKGNTIVEMLGVYPQIFDQMYIALADAGEQAGLLAEVLDREAKLLETLAKLKAQIKSALTYPIAISVLVVVVILIMLIFVIPIFSEMYESSGADLPALTQLLVDISNWLKEGPNILILLASALLMTFVFRNVFSNKKVQELIDKLILKVPVAGDLVVKSNLANFSRTLSSLSTAGVPLLEALRISRQTLGNSVFRVIIDKMYRSIELGEPIYLSLSSEPQIPKMFSSMFRIGEQTGELSAMVDKLADFYEDEVSTTVKSLTSILEPMMIVIVAGVVAVILVAMYLPMFNMMSTVS